MKRHLRLSRIFTTQTLALALGAFALLMSQSVPDARTGSNTPVGCPPAQARVPGSETVRTFRTSLNTLGDGFVEAIDSNTLIAISQSQPRQSGGQIQGLFIQVPVLEAGGALRGARFGWKDQHASLL